MSSESWNATPICSPKRAQRVDRRRRSTPAKCAPNSADGGDQRTGLVGQHARGSARSGRRPSRGPDGLADLPGHQPLERAGLQPDRVRAEVGQDVRTPGRTGSRRSGSRPCCPSARSPTTAPRRTRRLVHHVVVVERRQVGQLARRPPPARSRAASGRRSARPAATAADGTACRRRRPGSAATSATNSSSDCTAAAQRGLDRVAGPARTDASSVGVVEVDAERASSHRCDSPAYSFAAFVGEVEHRLREDARAPRVTTTPDGERDRGRAAAGSRPSGRPRAARRRTSARRCAGRRTPRSPSRSARSRPAGRRCGTPRGTRRTCR